jgi:hypothetical protein
VFIKVNTRLSSGVLGLLCLALISTISEVKGHHPKGCHHRAFPGASVQVFHLYARSATPLWGRRSKELLELLGHQPCPPVPSPESQPCTVCECKCFPGKCWLQSPPGWASRTKLRKWGEGGSVAMPTGQLPVRAGSTEARYREAKVRS